MSDPIRNFEYCATCMLVYDLTLCHFTLDDCPLCSYVSESDELYDMSNDRDEMENERDEREMERDQMEMERDSVQEDAYEYEKTIGALDDDLSEAQERIRELERDALSHEYYRGDLNGNERGLQNRE